MEIKTLQEVPLIQILDAFNLSFSDYLIPMHLTEPQLADKIRSENIRLDLSAGAFRDDELIGFILHGFDTIDGESLAYNAGTGVVPAERGQAITRKLYEHIIPVLKKKNIHRVLLEVITANHPAIRSYTGTGFRIARNLHCFKGGLGNSQPDGHFRIRELENYDWEKLRSFWDFAPTWQNTPRAMEMMKATNVSIGLYDNELLLGYLIYNPKSKRIQQFAVAKDQRNRGIGTQLFRHIALNYGNEVSLINIDGRAESTLKFLSGLGLKNFISQYEMDLELN